MSLSRAIIQRCIRQGLVSVNEQSVSSNHKLHSGDQIQAFFKELPAPPTDREMLPENIPLDIIYEDEHLLVVNKPPGLVVHPAPGHWSGTLVNALLWHLQKGQEPSDEGKEKLNEILSHTPHPISPVPRAGIVHRLDKDTSGLLLVAKDPLVHSALSKQLKARKVKRRYSALIEGHPVFDNGTVNAAIGRHAKHRKEMTVRHLGGRMAVTHYSVIKRLSIYESEEGTFEPDQPSLRKLRGTKPTPQYLYSLLEVTLETGRTHQIRVHMAHLGHPILGDATYGKRTPSFWQKMAIKRQLLHAKQLTFEHPVSKQNIVVSAPLPKDMTIWAEGAV